MKSKTSNPKHNPDRRRKRAEYDPDRKVGSLTVRSDEALVWRDSGADDRSKYLP